MKNNDLISVIVPAYNASSTITDTVKSIINQTYKDIEIILVDDGSTDSTLEVINGLSKIDNRIKVLHQDNGGVTTARLNGIKHATGEWIGFVDADDLIETDFYERLYNNAIKYNADISHCGYQIVVNNGERIHYFYDTGKLVLQNNYDGIKDLLEGSFIEPGLWNKIFNKNLFQSLLQENLIDLSIKINEDLLMNYFLFKNSSYSIYEDFCGYHYISNPKSVSRSQFNTNKIEDPLKVWDIIAEDISDNYLNIINKGYIFRYLCLYNLYLKDKNMKYKYTRKELLSRKEYWKYTSKNLKIKLYLACYMPHIYKIILFIYEKHFQKTKYE